MEVDLKKMFKRRGRGGSKSFYVWLFQVIWPEWYWFKPRCRASWRILRNPPVWWYVSSSGWGCCVNITRKGKRCLMRFGGWRG